MNPLNKTVLIADDSNLVVKILSEKLNKAGYNTLHSEDGEQAFTFFDGREIDLLITDLNMPIMNGLNLIRAIRSTDKYKYIPIVLFVSNEISDLKLFIKSSGATIGFDKSGVHGKLLSVIKRVIG